MALHTNCAPHSVVHPKPTRPPAHPTTPTLSPSTFSHKPPLCVSLQALPLLFASLHDARDAADLALRQAAAQVSVVVALQAGAGAIESRCSAVLALQFLSMLSLLPLLLQLLYIVVAIVDTVSFLLLLCLVPVPFMILLLLLLLFWLSFELMLSLFFHPAGPGALHGGCLC